MKRLFPCLILAPILLSCSLAPDPSSSGTPSSEEASSEPALDSLPSSSQPSSSSEAPSSEGSSSAASSLAPEAGEDIFYSSSFREGGEDSSSSAPGNFYLWSGYGCGGEAKILEKEGGVYSFSYKASTNWWSVQLFYQAPYAEEGEELSISFPFCSDVTGAITINGSTLSCKAGEWGVYESKGPVRKNSQGYLSTLSLQLGVESPFSCLSGSLFRFKAPRISSSSPYHRVDFLVDGKNVKSLPVKEGKKAVPPSDPIAPSGKHFAGWYEGEARFDGDAPIYATHSYSARFASGEGSLPSYVPEGYSLSWSDEFSGSALDPSSWECQKGIGQDVGLWEWGNQEKQYYKAENATVRDGRLRIEAKREDTSYGSSSYRYTSARIRSAGKVSFAHGYVEARISLPEGRGLWPAFWMLPEGSFEGKGWPYSGEIDIMEARGRLPYQTSSALHCSLNGGNEDRCLTSVHDLSSSFSSFHTYSVLWEENRMVFSVDGTSHLEVSRSEWMGGYNGNSPFDKEFHILLNLAVGGSFDGGVLPEEGFTSASMEVDYVRVYQK